MKNYRREYRFGESDNRIIFQDKTGKIWDSEELNELANWELEEMGLHVAEI